DDRFANRSARHAERYGQLSFRRQARSSRKLAARDQLRDLIGDLPIKALRLDGLQRHSEYPPAPVDQRTVANCFWPAASGLLPILAVVRYVVKLSGHRTIRSISGAAPRVHSMSTLLKCPDLPPLFSSSRTSS